MNTRKLRMHKLYGGHIELIRFKEHYGMPKGAWARSDILAQYLRLLGQFAFNFS